MKTENFYSAHSGSVPLCAGKKKRPIKTLTPKYAESRDNGVLRCKDKKKI